MSKNLRCNRLHIGLVLVIAMVFGYSDASAQDFVEFGVPQTIVTSRSDATFLQRHGAFVHVGYNFTKYAVHLKGYSGHVYLPFQTEYGYGFGVARTNSMKIDSNLKFDVGLGALRVLKRYRQRPEIARDFYSVFLELKIRYNLSKHFYFTSQLAAGYGTHRAKNTKIHKPHSFDTPYPSSIGFGVNLNGFRQK